MTYSGILGKGTYNKFISADVEVEDLINKVINNQTDPSIGTFTVDKLTDQVLLSMVAKEDENVFVREAAVKKLIDRTILAKIVIEDENSDVRDAAKQRLSELRRANETVK